MKVRSRSFTVLLTTTLVCVLVAGGFSFVWLRNAHAGRGPQPGRRIPNITQPVTNSTPFNNEGISPDATPTVGNFDGGGPPSALVCTTGCTSDSQCLAGWSCGHLVLGQGTCTCTATPEVCNGKDDDCNGVIDEGCGLGTLALLHQEAGFAVADDGFVDRRAGVYSRNAKAGELVILHGRLAPVEVMVAGQRDQGQVELQPVEQ